MSKLCVCCHVCIWSASQVISLVDALQCGTSLSKKYTLVTADVVALLNFGSHILPTMPLAHITRLTRLLSCML